MNIQKVDGQLTFRDLDGNMALPTPGSMLENWYISVRDIKISELDVANLARACRQNVYVDHVVPFCLNELKKNSQAGFLYAGELVQALRCVRRPYWSNHPNEKATFLTLVKHGYEETGNVYLKVAEADIH